MNPVVEFLETIPLFEGMSGLEINAVSAFLESRRYAAGEVVFREGNPGNEMFIVRTGKVVSWINQDGHVRRDIYEFLPGRFFGEMAIIEDEPRSATCEAVMPTELLVLDGIDFFRLVWEHPMIGVKMLSAMARVMVSWLDETSGFLNDLVRWGESARRRAITDDLSGLFNRRFLEESMRLDFSQTGKKETPRSLLMLDIDRFRDINAVFGALAGDCVISQIGVTFGLLIGDRGIVARLAGDEFAFFLPGTGPHAAAAIAELVRKEAESMRIEFRRGQNSQPERVVVTVSIGIASSPDNASDPKSLMEVADKALFKAKAEGRNRIVLA